MKKRYKKSLRLVTLLISSVLIATVSAAAYVTMQWTASTPVGDYPQVTFFAWGNETKYNSFTYSANIFPDVKTVDENITYGIWNTHGTENRTVYFRLASENTNGTDVDWLNYTVYDGTTTIYSNNYTFTTGDDTDAFSSGVTAINNTKYTIWIEIQAASNAVDGHNPQFTFEMKVDNP